MGAIEIMGLISADKTGNKCKHAKIITSINENFFNEIN